jgi:ubiquinone/menaquinone biosynthesis C-methylase UbiE
MTSTDVAFAGSIPIIYDRYLGDLLFDPYAQDLVARAVALRPARLLETAAGTGIVTALLVAALPEAQLVVTDLNQAMVDVASSKISSPRAEFATADAQSLPFADGSFDLVVCQFGMMFLPDRGAGYREAKRVLKAGGHLLFNVWDRLERNPATQVAADAVCALFPDDPPRFFQRVPFGYHDPDAIVDEVRSAGFSQINLETVSKVGRAAGPREAAIGLCQGTPLRNEIEARGDLETATGAATQALSAAFGSGPIQAPMSAHVVSARA